MNMQDFTNKNNERADAVAKLQAFCDAHNLSYEYGMTDFVVKLPGSEPIPIYDRIATKRKQADMTGLDNWTTSWGTKGVDENDDADPEQYKITEGS